LQEYSRQASRSRRGHCAATKRSTLASVHMTTSGDFGKQTLPPSCSSVHGFFFLFFFLPFVLRSSSCFTQNSHSVIWIMLLRAVKLFIILYICMIQCNIACKQDETTPFFLYRTSMCDMSASTSITHYEKTIQKILWTALHTNTTPLHVQT
jgi:hypothetical protein